MKYTQLFLAFFLTLCTTFFPTRGFSYPRLNWRDAEFERRRVITESAWKTQEEAQRRGDALHFERGFQNLGTLWIPFYRNLSGKQLYSGNRMSEVYCSLVQ